MKTLLTSILILSLSALFSQNNALIFDGTNDYLITDTINMTSMGGDVTIEAWIYPTSFDHDAFIAGINAPNGHAYLHLTNANSYTSYKEIEFVVSFESYGIFLELSEESWISLAVNNWYHIVGVFDGTNLRIYINGRNTDTNTFEDSYDLTANSEFYIGGKGSNDKNFTGQIDEVKLWSSARSTSEIREDMYKELTGSEDDLVAYYKLNETSGTTAYDTQTSDTYNATLKNMDNNDWLPSSAFFGPKKCLKFNNYDKSVEISSVFGLGTTSVSGECWVNIPSTSERGAFIHIGDAPKNATDVGYGIGVGGGGWHTWDDLGNELLILYDNIRWIPTGTNIGTGWHHVAFTIGSTGNLTAYLDGVAVYTETGNTNIPPKQPTNVSSIGSSDGRARVFSNGYIDEVRLWSDIRTKTEIRTNMSKTLVGNEDNLVAYYNFDNTTENQIQNFSSNNTDALIRMQTGSLPDSDWINSSAFNTWLNTNSTAWATTGNWSQNSTPISTDNVGIYNYSGESPSLSGSPTINNIFIDSLSNLSLSSNITINGNVFVYDDVDLNNYTITLGSSAYLFEESGIISGNTGKITTTRNLNNISSENIGGIGASITTAANMGSTTIERHHNSIGGASNSIKRWFVIEPTNNTNLNASLTFNYSDSELNGNTESTLSLYRSTDNGTTWSDMGSTRNVDANTLSLSSIDHFSWWTATKTNSTLPVEITNFDGINLQNKNKLNWNTASETNNKDFIIERSIDGINYTQICKVEGKRNSNQQNKYQYFDYNIKSNKAYYYRLSNEDFDGTINNIKTIYLENQNQKSNIKVYPNPFNDYISINLNNESDYGKVTIFNSKGIPVLQKEINSFTKINTKNLEKGNYLIQIISNNKLDNYKILK